MFSFKYALSHLRHQLKANNRHGLHSPFVYRLVDEVIYDFSEKKIYQQISKVVPDGKKLTSVDKLLYRLVADANPGVTWILGKHTAADLHILQQAAPVVKQVSINDTAAWRDPVTPGVYFIDARLNPQGAIDHFNRLLGKTNADTMLIVHNIHAHMLTKASWDVMRSHQKVTASVNLFWMGLLFFRPGQKKEDFWIKY